MEPRDKRREVPPSAGSYSKHPSDGCITADTGAEVGGQPAVTVQLMCVDCADVIYSLFWASIRLWHATDNACSSSTS